MRTKLFAAFISVILIALLSNILFERMILRDFDEYVESTKEDHVYWILASVEGAYDADRWKITALENALHWAMMLGYDAYVETPDGERLLSTQDVLFMLSPVMQKRMQSIFVLPYGQGKYEWYPLYVGGKHIGRLYIRPLKRLGNVSKKEMIFRKRGRDFLITSFLIAGGGALFLAALFSTVLSKPLRALSDAARKVANGEFSIKVKPKKRQLIPDEIDNLTESFNFMVEALRKEDQIRRHLTSNIVHELRTPLAIMKATIEALEDRVIEDPKEAINTIRKELERLIVLVEGIEDITRAEASFFKRGRPEIINLEEFLNEIINGMRHLFKEKGLFLKTEGRSLQVRAYPDKLHIVLKNLLSNAYKFTSKGGVTVKWGTKGEEFFISITDTGRGLQEEEKTKIFERFYRGEDSKGRGLGLSIAKELVEVMEGRIIVDSIHGKGTTFTVLLPQGLKAT